MLYSTLNRTLHKMSAFSIVVSLLFSLFVESFATTFPELSNINSLTGISKQLVDNLPRIGQMTQPRKEQKFYIFISFSMPTSLIRAYMDEASDLHAILVLRGVSKQMRLQQFIVNKILPLLKDKKTSSELIINPILFERFNVNIVPTFVYEMREKLSGAVTARWALEQFKTYSNEHKKKRGET